MKETEPEGTVSFEYNGKKRLRTIKISNVPPNSMAIVTPFVADLITALKEATKASKRHSVVSIVLTAVLLVLTALLVVFALN